MDGALKPAKCRFWILNKARRTLSYIPSFITKPRTKRNEICLSMPLILLPQTTKTMSSIDLFQQCSQFHRSTYNSITRNMFWSKQTWTHTFSFRFQIQFQYTFSSFTRRSNRRFRRGTFESGLCRSLVQLTVSESIYRLLTWSLKNRGTSRMDSYGFDRNLCDSFLWNFISVEAQFTVNRLMQLLKSSTLLIGRIPPIILEQMSLWKMCIFKK